MRFGTTLWDKSRQISTGARQYSYFMKGSAQIVPIKKEEAKKPLLRLVFVPNSPGNTCHTGMRRQNKPL